MMNLGRILFHCNYEQDCSLCFWFMLVWFLVFEKFHIIFYLNNLNSKFNGDKKRSFKKGKISMQVFWQNRENIHQM